ncbi:Flavin-dependent halogenase malA [Paramyrothecium foliicola]|nr:Flavin-dependent halogenase malA [Paramyrothecium foliicola]
MTTMATAKHIFAERAAAGNLSDAQVLNSNNAAGSEVPSKSDIVVAGGGIHGLIYAIHAAKHRPNDFKISLIEKSSKPGYKIGESTLPVFAMWCKMYGLTGEYLLRIFGVKDGLAFYFHNRDNQEDYSDFLINGTPGHYLSGYQLERPMSELLFTLMAQRNGINVYHGRKIDFASSKVGGGLQNSKIVISESKPGAKAADTVDTSLLVDATGRFRQLASKNASLHRFEGFNTDAFWGYFTYPDESKANYRHYEGSHTNHLCFPEGWFWVIRLLSWQGNPIANLMDMLTYLLDCAEAGVPGDQVPSTEELAKMFGLKYRWVTSIGVAARNDVKYPEDMSVYGSTEAERKFNYFVKKYPLIDEFMANHELIENLYGPGTTWFVRKTLTYQSPVVSGPGWLAIGDACGFTNPLYSPGINVGMASSTYAAELTHEALNGAKAANKAEAIEPFIRKTFAPYDEFVTRLIPALDQMNRFNYHCFRDPRLGAQIACMWQYFAGVIAGYDPVHVDGTLTLTPQNFIVYAKNWKWGSLVPEYNAVARKVIELLGPIPLEEAVPEATVQELIEFADKMKSVALSSNPVSSVRWAGKLRSHDNSLSYNAYKQGPVEYREQVSSVSVTDRQYRKTSTDHSRRASVAIVMASQSLAGRATLPGSLWTMAVYGQAAFVCRRFRIYAGRLLRELCPKFLEHQRKSPTGACAASLEPSLTPRPDGTSIQFLNGLRGIACIIVFNFHFLYAHTTTIFNGYNPTTEHRWLHQLPLLSLPTRGRAMVMVFFVCSGYVLSHRYLQLLRSGNLEAAQRSLSSLAVRRYIRLYAPPAVSMLMVALAAYIGIYDKSRAFNDGDTHRGYWEQHPPRLPSFMAQMNDYIGMLRDWGNPWSFTPYYYSLYDPHTWTIPLELRGSFALFITLVLRTRLRMPWGIILVAIITYSAHLYGRWELVSFLGGALVAEVHQISRLSQQLDWQYKENNASQDGLMLPCAAATILATPVSDLAARADAAQLESRQGTASGCEYL